MMFDASNLKNCRLAKKLTQKQLSEMLGITQQAYAQYESGKRTPKLDTLRRIAKALDVDWTELVPVEQQSELIINDLKSELRSGGPWVELTTDQAVEVGFVNRDPQARIKYFYGRIAAVYNSLNTDGKLAAARGMFNNLDESKLTEVLAYMKKLADTPQYQNIKPDPDDTNQ
jgi:transcriptional regulator with XRE-family HTH domain